MPTTWLITGCSSGFGELFVRQLRAEGDNVIATGRNANVKLAHLAETGATILDLDVAASPDVIHDTIKAAWELFPGGIDVVVNNAGFILSGAIEELSDQDLVKSMRTNFHGPLNITRSILPMLREKGNATLLYVSSQAAWHGDPSAAAYCASKAALEGAVECLAKELEIFAPKIKVLIAEPGYFNTKAFSNIDHVSASVPAYAQFNAGVRQFEAGLVGNEPGDSVKCVSCMIDLVRHTGLAAGRDIPLRVPLGSDGWGRIKAKCEETLRVCDEWEDMARSTDIRPMK